MIGVVAADLSLGLSAHFVIRPLLAGLVAAVAVFFVSEYVCRTHVWPAFLGTMPIEGNRGIWRVRVAHRLLLLWLAIGFLPLSAVALTASMRMDGLDEVADPVLVRVVSVVIFIAASAALGGAGLAGLLARSMDRPLRALELGDGAIARRRLLGAGAGEGHGRDRRTRGGVQPDGRAARRELRGPGDAKPRARRRAGPRGLPRKWNQVRTLMDVW